MTTLDRRQDRATASTVTEVLRMKSAFGETVAYVFAVRRKIPLSTVERVLAGRYDPRQRPDQAGSSGTSSPYLDAT